MGLERDEKSLGLARDSLGPSSDDVRWRGEGLGLEQAPFAVRLMGRSFLVFFGVLVPLFLSIAMVITKDLGTPDLGTRNNGKWVMNIENWVNLNTPSQELVYQLKKNRIGQHRCPLNGGLTAKAYNIRA